MALPTGPYQGQDLINWQEGNKFLPREFYSLNPPPSQIQTNTIGNTGGVTNTNVAQSYMGYPSYEAWLLAQGGGGGNGGVDEIEEDTFSMGMSPGAMGGKLPGFGNWAKRTAGTLGHAYSQLPTPTNLLFKGIRRWKEKREIKKEQQRIAEDRTGIGDHDRGTFEGPHPDRPTKTPEQGGWHPGVNGGTGNTGGLGTDTPSGHAGDWGPGAAQGGRIGLSNGMTPFMAWVKDQYGVNVGDIKDWNFYSGLANEWKILEGKKHGGLIGYFDGGIARLL